ncbi:putative ABC transport system permease protein [Tumebacillus sp. BK434]|uniref:ABC transporter permease n=1 Tax=Tumebacillus sp. BK434 TaxID=2512169 RepID=UPI0010EE30C4|nr:FtsX-like permease family protein [Tumebacillus sp. BK434]TCP55751.1 putative ABC transport system permease protein [Tumebacillus sp. BK434]
MVLNKRIWRIIRQNKAQYVSAMVLVVLSCLLFTLLSVMAANLQDNAERFVRDYKLEDVKTVVQLPIANVPDVEKAFGVQIEPRYELDVEWKPEVTLRLFDASEKVNVPALVAGSPLQANDDILLSPSFAQAQGVQVGSVITLGGDTYTVRGLMAVPDYIYALKSESDIMMDPQSFGVAVITKEKMQELGTGTLYYNIKGNSPELKAYLEQHHKLLLWKPITENPRYQLADSKIRQTADLAAKVPTAMLFLTCLLLATAMWRLVKMEFTQIGTLYALGYKKGEILRHYLCFPLLIGLCGGVTGTLLGLLVLPPLLDYVGLYFNVPMLKTDWNLQDLVLSVFLPLLFLLPATAIVVWRALRLKPVVLMRGHMKTVKAGRLMRAVNLSQLSFTAKFKVRELMRNTPKSLLMLVGVMMASVFLLFGFAAHSSINSIVEDSFGDTFTYQYNTMFNKLQTENRYGGEVYNVLPVALTGDADVKFSLYGVQPDGQLLSLKDADGREIALAGKTVITRALAESTGLGIGDTLTVRNLLKEEQTYELQIDAVAEVYTGNAVYLPLAALNELLKLPATSYLGVYSLQPLQAAPSQVLRVENRADVQRALDSALEPMRYTLLLTGTFAFVIALIVIYVITSLIIEENKSNISMLKVLGYTPKEINGLVLNAGQLPVVLGYLLGIPATISSLQSLLNSSLQGIDMAIPIQIDPLHLLFGFVIIYGTYEMSKLLSKKKVLSVSMAESLKMQRD